MEEPVESSSGGWSLQETSGLDMARVLYSISRSVEPRTSRSWSTGWSGEAEARSSIASCWELPVDRSCCY